MFAHEVTNPRQTSWVFLCPVRRPPRAHAVGAESLNPPTAPGRATARTNRRSSRPRHQPRRRKQPLSKNRVNLRRAFRRPVPRVSPRPRSTPPINALPAPPCKSSFLFFSKNSPTLPHAHNARYTLARIAPSRHNVNLVFLFFSQKNELDKPAPPWMPKPPPTNLLPPQSAIPSAAACAAQPRMSSLFFRFFFTVTKRFHLRLPSSIQPPPPTAPSSPPPSIRDIQSHRSSRITSPTAPSNSASIPPIHLANHHQNQNNRAHAWGKVSRARALILCEGGGVCALLLRAR